MNSFLQQLFLMPSLRQEILELQVAMLVPSLAVRVRCGALISCTNAAHAFYNCLRLALQQDKEGLVAQVQRLFLGLAETYRRFCDTKPLCGVMKTLDGEPITLTQQMDVDEFMRQVNQGNISSPFVLSRQP
jgi:hypothetical protein